MAASRAAIHGGKRIREWNADERRNQQGGGCKGSCRPWTYTQPTLRTHAHTRKTARPWCICHRVMRHKMKTDYERALK
eukprot:6183669-Pleurochrysis_carterae.AAC.3